MPFHLNACREIVLENEFETGSQLFTAEVGNMKPCYVLGANNKSIFSDKIQPNISVSPNPFIESISINVTDFFAEDISIFLYNSIGTLIFSNSYKVSNNTLNLLIKSISPGFYSLKIIVNQSESKTFKLIHI